MRCECACVQGGRRWRWLSCGPPCLDLGPELGWAIIKWAGVMHPASIFAQTPRLASCSLASRPSTQRKPPATARAHQITRFAGSIKLEEIQITWRLVPGSSVFEMSKKREMCPKHFRAQTVATKWWCAQRWPHRRGRRQCESFSVCLSRCAGLVQSLTARRVTGEIEKLTPSSRRAEGAALLEHLRSRSSVDPAPCDQAKPLGSTDDEAWMGAQPPLVVVVVSGYGCFCKCHKSPSPERFLTAPHNPVRHRSAGSCAPIDRMLTTLGLWVFVGTVPARDLMLPCHDDCTTVD